MKSILVTLMAAVSLSTATQAQLGWTLEQCKAKFGEPKTEYGDPATTVDSGRTHTSFLSDKYTTTVTFSNDGFVTTVSFFRRSHYKFQEGESIVQIVDSDEVKSWFQYGSEVKLLSDMERISKEYNGIAWKLFHQLQDGAFVGYKHGKPVMELSSDKNSILLYNINAKELAEEIKDATS